MTTQTLNNFPSPQLEDGYIRISNELWDALCRTRIPGEERQILDVIFRKTYGFNKKTDAIPLSQFEAATGLKRSTVCRAINSLEEKRLISLKRETGRVTIYGINKLYSQWGLVSKKRRPNIESPKNDNLPVSKKRHSKDILSKDNKTISSFSIFYGLYPRKAGKAAAEKAWLKIKPDEILLGVMMAALQWQREQDGWKKDKGKFIPLPGSWLNGRRWEDEQPQAAKSEECAIVGEEIPA